MEIDKKDNMCKFQSVKKQKCRDLVDIVILNQGLTRERGKRQKGDEKLILGKTSQLKNNEISYIQIILGQWYNITNISYPFENEN